MNLLLISVAWLGCTNSGLGRTDTGVDSGASTSQQNCPWVGTWSLTELLCSSLPYDAWDDTYEGATMEIDHDPAGGCTVEMTLVGDGCERAEAWRFVPPEAGVDTEVTFLGIQDCEPNKCVMEAGGAECTQGDLQAGPEVLALDGSVEGKITARGLLEDTAAQCPLDIVTEWSLE